MTIWAVIPVKALNEGKSRLSELLSEDQRFKLNLSLVRNTIRVLSEIEEIDEIMVISSDLLVSDIAKEFKARFMKEDGAPGLNRALNLASHYANQEHVTSLLILHADLPLLDKCAVRLMLTPEAREPYIRIAPDHNGIGTNGLYLSPFGGYDYKFGSNSFSLHLEEANRLSYHIKIVNNHTLGLDLDVPEDISLLTTYGYDLIKQYLDIIDHKKPGG